MNSIFCALFAFRFLKTSSVALFSCVVIKSHVCGNGKFSTFDIPDWLFPACTFFSLPSVSYLFFYLSTTRSQIGASLKSNPWVFAFKLHLQPLISKLLCLFFCSFAMHSHVLSREHQLLSASQFIKLSSRFLIMSGFIHIYGWLWFTTKHKNLRHFAITWKHLPR